MRDFFGNNLYVGNKVIVMFHAHTTSALVYGRVTDVLPGSIKYEVIRTGYQAEYGRHAEPGEVRKCTSSEKIINLAEIATE